MRKNCLRKNCLRKNCLEEELSKRKNCPGKNCPRKNCPGRIVQEELFNRKNCPSVVGGRRKGGASGLGLTAWEEAVPGEGFAVGEVIEAVREGVRKSRASVAVGEVERVGG